MYKEMDAVCRCCNCKAEADATATVCPKCDYYICANCPRAKASTPGKRSFKDNVPKMWALYL
jgi:hypothetical protein